ncbi:unnamed protein product [Microthlaspi erraticum]|uniref:Arabidopsis retrotransposon Orf1 C-terminal domain-containing protein n=1 Tax=Microthlaspi erraticum TaxID=1685480 RepID=A0A6D2JBD6_9BRAS|nr:unnamed protein product [Microthlaspi erraticum]
MKQQEVKQAVKIWGNTNNLMNRNEMQKVNKAVEQQLDQGLESSWNRVPSSIEFRVELKPPFLEQEILELLVDLFQRFPSLPCGESPMDIQARLDRVEAWPVELRNSTGWSSRWSSWSSRWLPPSSFAYPVELRPCAKSSFAPHVPYAPNAPKDLFQRTKHAYYINNLGVGVFMSKRHGSYKEATCQFLASLTFDLCKEGQHTPDGSDESITFWASGQRHYLSLQEIDRAYYLGLGNRYGLVVDKDEMRALWEVIASGDYQSSTAKSAHIRSPPIRYLHKCLANALYPRVITGNIN